MICVVIKGPTIAKAKKQITRALAFADLVELRLDYFNKLDIEALRSLRSECVIPMIFTLRSNSQGGVYQFSERKRLQDMRELFELHPDYFDLESHIDPDFVTEISEKFPNVKLILSYHDFLGTPDDLEAIFAKMQSASISYYKLAVFAKNSMDAFRLMDLAKKQPGTLIAISMGVHGQITRILAPKFNNPITYVTLDEEQLVAPGQIAAKTLIEQYHYRKMNANTDVYGLIGDPVDRSISDVTHNYFFEIHGIDAVYVKMQVESAQLSTFLDYAKQLPFKGISVTMPLKEKIMPFLDYCDLTAEAIGAVNTLVIEKGKVLGFNTDGIGALNAIEKEGAVKDKHILIIGAGGAARAIAFEALSRGARVTLVNRDVNKVRRIAQHLGCQGISITDMKQCANNGYDVLINCTPLESPITSDEILSTAIIMDITTKPKDTLFIQMAKQKGCRVIYGYHMFIEQAFGQFELWCGEYIGAPTSRCSFQEKVLSCL